MTLLSIHYKAALALNNMGVSLLSRHQYHFAMESFKDAIFVMKMLILNEMEREDENEENGHSLTSNPGYVLPTAMHAEVESKLQQASQRLASIDVVTSDAALTCDRLHSLRLSVLSDNSPTPTAFTKAMENDHLLSANKLSEFVFFVEPNAHESHDERDVDLDTSIMLHNYAVSCKILSRVLRTLHMADQMQSCSQRVFRLAYNTITTREVSDDEESVLPNRFIVSALLIHKCQLELNLFGQNDEGGDDSSESESSEYLADPPVCSILMSNANPKEKVAAFLADLARTNLHTAPAA